MGKIRMLEKQLADLNKKQRDMKAQRVVEVVADEEETKDVRVETKSSKAKRPPKSSSKP
jgi:hypothetical protein